MRRSNGSLVSMPTAAQLVADAIRRRIVTGQLADGQSLPPEPVLIEHFGVSRPTLREALRILQSESLLSIRRGSRGGARVNGPQINAVARQAGYLLQHQSTTVKDVYEARLVIEPPAAGLLAANGHAAALHGLQQALEQERRSVADPATFARDSARFHKLVIELAGNKTLALFAGILSEIIDAHTHSVMLEAHDTNAVGRDSDTAHRSHERLLELVTARDEAGARAHWLAHMETIGAIMLEGKGARPLVDLFS
jgi:DNA-binding FadR family transcriptional regulator